MGNIFERPTLPKGLPPELRLKWIRFRVNPFIAKLKRALDKIKIKYESPAFKGNQFCHILIEKHKAAVVVSSRQKLKTQEIGHVWERWGYKYTEVSEPSVDRHTEGELSKMFLEWLKK